jgi:hypothetical protein
VRRMIRNSRPRSPIWKARRRQPANRAKHIQAVGGPEAARQ